MRRFDFIPEGTEGCSVTAWLHGEGEGCKSSPAIIICPGGGYTRVSAREAEPVAGPYYEAGYHTFILTYSVGEKAKDFTPLCQLEATLAHIREYADRWNVDPKKSRCAGFRQEDIWQYLWGHDTGKRSSGMCFAERQNGRKMEGVPVMGSVSSARRIFVPTR